MDNGIQSTHSTPLTTNAGEARTNMYYFQVKPNTVEGSIDTGSFPLQVLINEQDGENEQYSISVVQARDLQLLVDPPDQHSTNASTHYDLPPGLQINTEISNSLQFLTNQRYKNTRTETELLDNALPEMVSNPIMMEKKGSHTKRFDSHQRKVIQKFVHISDRAAPPRAVAVLPAALQVRRAVVSPRRPLPARVRFGPVEGISCKLTIAEAVSLVLESTSSHLPVFLVKTEEDAVIHIDVSDKDKSNWLSLLPLGDQGTANVWLVQEEGSLFALTTRPIPARTPLAVGYSKEYADTHGIPEGQPVLDLDAELTKHRKWWCYECQRLLPSAALLQRHGDVHHLEEKQRSQQRYRCKHCARTFCRLFTLRRHVSRHCTREDKGDAPKESQEPINGLLYGSKPEELPELSLNTTNAEDSRLPSDESLQTLTNNLDFSTNLFDTDRMPNLDISGSSRSDTDFNPYSLGLKDDIGLANGIEFPEPDDCGVKKEVNSSAPETVFLTCRHCDQTVVKGRQRQHVKMCPGRKFQCECGRSFPYKDKLALHIHLDHGSDLTAVKEKNAAKELDSQQYRCETCKHTFKRRGMLVNHLWRVHAQPAAGVPLERRERVFPCAACPKLYRSAAKRARHARAHHPGCELPAAPAVEGGRRACEPAACAACPRQYATRAKLLQHVRARHPLLAPPVKRHVAAKKIIK